MDKFYYQQHDIKAREKSLYRQCDFSSLSEVRSDKSNYLRARTCRANRPCRVVSASPAPLHIVVVEKTCPSIMRLIAWLIELLFPWIICVRSGMSKHEYVLHNFKHIPLCFIKIAFCIMYYLYTCLPLHHHHDQPGYTSYSGTRLSPKLTILITIR